MKISLNWLKEYIDLSGIEVNELVEKITTAGFEVEEIIDQSKVFENMCVGFVKEVKKHPNADKLSLCLVSDGKEDFNVICGAPNVATGQKVPFAKVGAIIPSNGLKLEKIKIRGEVSLGMICSEKELGLSEDHQGIMVLDSDALVGMDLADALGQNDIILDIAITPNRADALSHIGIAREIAALYKRKFQYPKIELVEDKKRSEEIAKVEIKDVKNCPRYIGKVVEDVVIKESPTWLQQRLKSVGLRPINNVVDVTNFVLYEVGQPLHAFDLDKLADKKIVVKCATENEKFTTLDSKERILSSEDLMICDANKNIAIAGVMGGENSEVTSETKNILIESAFFNPSSIRRTAKKLGLSTDASFRFERGTDYEITIWAARRAAQLIQKTAGGKILSDEIDVYPIPFDKRKTNLRFERVSKILGYDVPKVEVLKILEDLGFEISEKSNDRITVLIPSYRHDVEREIDLIEEIARVYGFDKIPDVSRITVTLEEKVDQAEFNDNVRNKLTSLGFFEIITNSLVNENIAKMFGNAIKMLNPQSNEMSHLRSSLLSGMLQAVSNNLKVSEKNLKLFEIGKTFQLKTVGEIYSFDDFIENEQLIIGLSGHSVQNEWYDEDKAFTLHDLKGYVESFFKSLLPNTEMKFEYGINNDWLTNGFSLINNYNQLGIGGKVKKDYLKLFDINQDIFVFIFELAILKQIQHPTNKFNELLKYPKVYRDVAFILDKTVTSGEVIEEIKIASSNLLHQTKLFDIFQSDSLGKDKKSLAFQLEYYDFNRTLTEEEVEKDFRNAIKAVEKRFDAQLRGA